MPQVTESTPSAPWKIGAVSFIVLILELALIRFIPSEIKAISYFTNIIIFASFFGLGLGCMHFLWNTQETYDLIVFGTLDSQTLLSGYSNLRLENYVYTTESFTDAQKALADGGMLATYYSVFKPWFYGRIYATIHAVFPTSIKLIRFQNNYLFNTIIMAAKGLPGFQSDPGADADFRDQIPSTDNWPYMYLERPMVSPLYIEVLTVFLVFAALAFVVLYRRTRERAFKGNFFFMGLGFTLLESAAIVRLTLLFGSTWIVTSVVFSSALLMIFIGNLLVMKGKAPPMFLSCLGLTAALVANLFAAPEWFLAYSLLPRTLAAGALIGLPVLCASICFSHMFVREKTAGYALGINLIGAMCGGIFEYLSMWLGMPVSGSFCSWSMPEPFACGG